VSQPPGGGVSDRLAELLVVEPDRRPILPDFDGRQADPTRLHGRESTGERLAVPGKDQDEGAGAAATDELDRERIFLGQEIGDFQDPAVLQGRGIDQREEVNLGSSGERRDRCGLRRADIDEENRGRDQSREDRRRRSEEERLPGYLPAFQISTPETLAWPPFVLRSSVPVSENVTVNGPSLSQWPAVPLWCPLTTSFPCRRTS